MRGFLRIIGVVNAAIWFGSAIFVVIGVPGIFALAAAKILSKPDAGLAAQSVLARFFILQYGCAAIALGHFFADRFLLGRPARRSTLGLLIALSSLVLLGGFWLQPKLRNLHHTKYWGTVPAEQNQAAQSFGLWHGVSQIGNLLVIGGLFLYFVRVTDPKESERFGSFRQFGKFRS